MYQVQVNFDANVAGHDHRWHVGTWHIIFGFFFNKSFFILGEVVNISGVIDI